MNGLVDFDLLSSEELLAIAASSMRSGRGAEAVSLLRVLLRRDDANGRAHYLLAVEQSAMGHSMDARESFERAVALCPELVEARLQFAMLLIASGESAKARILLQERRHHSPCGAVLEDCCKVLDGLAAGNFEFAGALLGSIEAKDDVDLMLVGVVTSFLEERLQLLSTMAPESEPLFIGRYAKVDRHH